MSGRAYFETRASELYSLRIYYVILYEGSKYHASLTRTLQNLASEPTKGHCGTARILQQQ